MGSMEKWLPAQIVILQSMTSLVVAAAMLLSDNSQAGLGEASQAGGDAVAALLAGAVCVVPGGYFAWRAQNERSPGRLLGQGVMKFLLTVTLMALVFAVMKPAPLGFFASFVAMQLVYVVGPLVFGSSR